METISFQHRIQKRPNNSLNNRLDIIWKLYISAHHKNFKKYYKLLKKIQQHKQVAPHIPQCCHFFQEEKKIAMESTTYPPFQNLPKKEVDQSKGMTEIGVAEEHDDCYEIDFVDDDDEDHCYVINHSNHEAHYVINQCEIIEAEGYDNGDEDEYDDSDYDDDDDDDSCFEIVPTEFPQKISVQVPDNALAS